mmetsp:Transcript_98269/g.177433  ORF Transcript_98269/g.177433 Transcript_98269/m.177433 type:complete len:85 (+) Transcript_98269:98-352(+)
MSVQRTAEKKTQQAAACALVSKRVKTTSTTTTTTTIIKPELVYTSPKVPCTEAPTHNYDKFLSRSRSPKSTLSINRLKARVALL